MGKRLPPKPLFSLPLKIEGKISSIFTFNSTVIKQLTTILNVKIPNCSNSLFAVLTTKGELQIYDYKARRPIFYLNLNIENSSWASFIPKPSIETCEFLLTSREEGIFHAPNIFKDEVKKMTFIEKHSGFCKPSIVPLNDSEVFRVIFPSDMKTIISCSLESTLTLDCQMELKAPLTFTKSIQNGLFIAGAEDGVLYLIKCEKKKLTIILSMPIVVSDEELKRMKEDNDEHAVPLSCDGNPESGNYLIGNTSAELILISINNQDKWNMKIEKRAKVKNNGISFVTCRPDFRLVATGGWDFQIRIFTFPELNQLVVLSHHLSPLSDLVYLTHQNLEDEKPKFLLLSSSQETSITCWDIYN